MTTDIDLATLDLAALTDDGDELELPGGRVLVLKVEPDDDLSIMDEQGEGMWCGRLSWPVRNRETGRDERPRDFDGGARLIRFGCGYDAIWWQVPKDLLDGTSPAESLDMTERAIVRLLEEGYVQVGVQLWEVVTDSRDQEHRVMVDDAWIGGVDEVYPELVEELVEEVLGR